MLKGTLNLNDEQVQKLEPVLKEQQAKVAAMRKDTTLSRQEKMAKLKEAGQAADARLKAILTPEQIAKWHEMRTNALPRMHQWRQPAQQQPEPAK